MDLTQGFGFKKYETSDNHEIL